jgi:lanthanide-dependent methanol dehydrogenase
MRAKVAAPRYLLFVPLLVLLQVRAGPEICVTAQAEATHRDLQALMQDDKQWPTAAKNYANTRFSRLDQINPGNVNQLKLAWTFSLGAPRGQEAAPLVIEDTLFVAAPYAGVHPNQVFALDAVTGGRSLL